MASACLEPARPGRRFPWYVAALAGAAISLVAGAAWFPCALSRNLWSLQYAWSRLKTPLVAISLPAPPACHQRSSIWLARDAVQAGDLTRALALLSTLSAQNNREALRVAAQVYDRQGELATAIRTAALAHDDFALRLAAQHAVEAARPDMARLAYQEAMALDPEETLESWTGFLQTTDPAAAEAALREAFTRYPYSPKRWSWYYRLGEVLRTQGRWNEAESAYSSALAAKPNDPRTHIGLGQLRYERGQGLDAAVREFRLAIMAEPERAESYAALGRLYLKAGDLTQAGSAYRQALWLDPGNRYYSLQCATIARDNGDLSNAAAILRRIVAAYPDFAPAWYELAGLRHGQREWAEATAAIEQALAGKPAPTGSYYVLAGQIHEAAGRPERAAWAYRQALALESKNETALRGLQRLGYPR
jgi:tetratricopeptide (TPR) repeat protein